MSQGQKVFIVLDQFEQWLHAQRGEEDTELAHALRQCDGEHVQCVVMVRDDFWMGLTRFMQELQIEVVPGQNTAVVDLFDLRHAKKVLTAFGKAFGTLAEPLSKDQVLFLDQAVQGLAQDGRVISVRLALFAEMVKGKLWTPATLKEVGGMEGVGVAFLEETFNDSRLRPHQPAARAILKALLPEQGTDIKGNMQSQANLLEASGYASRPRDFEELLRILDNEVRLITPTDPAGADANASTTEKYYQLTHDYLVPSLREWLVRKQKETRRGRAELLLVDRAAVWNSRPENRQLPSLLQWFSIRRLTQKKNWTGPQRKMMWKASRFHAVRGLALALLLVVVTLTGLRIRGQVIEGNKATLAAGLVHQLLDAEIAQVPGIITQMKDFRPWTDQLLKKEYAEADKAGKEAGTEAERTKQVRNQLHASLALLPVDRGQVDYLYGRLLDAEPQEVSVIVKELAKSGHGQELVEPLWAIVEQPPKGDEKQRLRAACALATYDPGNARWDKASGPVVEQLVSINPVFLSTWLEGFRLAKDKLVVLLSVVFRDRKEERTAERSLAASILADYAADQIDLLVDLVQDADEKHLPSFIRSWKLIGNVRWRW